MQLFQQAWQQMAWRASWRWLLGGVLLAALGALLIVRWDIAQRRELFQTDARVAHRLLSQRVVQLDAVLATLSALPLDEPGLRAMAPRLLALYPELRAVQWLPARAPRADAALAAAEARSRASGQASLAGLDAARAQLTVVQALGAGQAVALQVDLQQLLPWGPWPIARGGPVRISLQHPGGTLLLQAGRAAADRPVGWTPGFVFSKAIAGSAEPLSLQLQLATGPAQWPWAGLLLWWAISLGGVAAAATLWRQRRARERAEALWRMGQVARLNTLGEMAAGLAHELNQPLAAVVANAQAARRVLDELAVDARGAADATAPEAADPEALATARDAMARVVAQGRRASEVVARLRRRLASNPAEAAAAVETLDLGQAVRAALDLLAPELRAHGVALHLGGPALAVRADPVALAQIVHNLVANALHALAAVPASARELHLSWRASPGTDPAPTHAELTVRDTGPGLSAEVLPRLFEPFYSTRADGLGLGLSLCESLAQAMDGTLQAEPAPPAGPHGAVFRLTLPLADVPQ